ncbi:PREDICTED: eukaryotic translation initiation factor 4 gamma 2-like, partial [Priapulus caudatus]|uniref:Eukaryotic translation initiation factor 4 gamma 2-like n=1 Tax=Priapulus caudatus TaxID=37621 RepID=A0ABM1F4J0_PRICU
MYAQLCRRLCEEAPNFRLEQGSGNCVSSFRHLLLNKCRDEFENRARAQAMYDNGRTLNAEEQEQAHIAKQKMLGNIKFIGELGKLDMLHETILHQCIKQLLEKKRTTGVSDMSEDLECLCQIMKTVGRRLDTDKARGWMEQYFERIRQFSYNPELPARIRFMLQDVMELRDQQVR